MKTPGDIATDLVRRLQAAGHEAFWVGGCVRDFLLGRTPQDYDIATSARPSQIEALFDRTIPVFDISWGAVLALAVITFISRITLFLGVKHLGGLQTAILGLGELIITVSVAQVWLGEKLLPLQWLGAALLAAALFLVGFDHHVPEKKYAQGILSWLNPPQIDTKDIPWQSPP